MLTPAAKGFQLFGTDPGTATSDVRTTPESLRIILVGSTESTSVKSPATNRFPKDSRTPHLTITGFLDCMVTITSSPTDKEPITRTVVLVATSV